MSNKGTCQTLDDLPQRLPSCLSLLFGAEMSANKGNEMYPVQYVAPAVIIYFRDWESVHMWPSGLWTAGPTSIDQSERRAAVSHPFSRRWKPGSLPPRRGQSPPWSDTSKTVFDADSKTYSTNFYTDEMLLVL